MTDAASELLTTAQMAEADRLTIAAGTPGIDLMERAGVAVADVISDLPGRRVVVVVGPGNNGGDGFVAARHLAERGYEVRVSFVGDRARLKGDAATAAARWSGQVHPAEPAQLDGCEIVIDALFGAGLDREVSGQARTMIDAINASGAVIIAVDLPSGVNGDTGAVMGAAVKAQHTVTFFRKKPGHILLPGRLHCGTVTVADIGIATGVLDTIKPKTFVNSPALWGARFPIPRVEGHKYTRGHAVVVSGGLSTTGAARLAARGALRAGAGLVTIASPADALAINAANSLAVMVREVDRGEALAGFLNDKRLNAVVLGPGGGVGAGMREQVLAALGSEAAVVLDADALTSFSDAPGPLPLFEAIERRRRATVLTPHRGEFMRIFSLLWANVELHSKLEEAAAAASMSSSVVVLKGADTVVAGSDGRRSISDNAPPYLATAGAGDVLAGMIAGLLAQGMEPFDAASAAVWLHGEAAAEVGPGLIAEDLTEALPAVYRRLFAAIAT